MLKIKHMRLVFFILLFLSISSFGQEKPKYFWKGKSVTYKQYRDSLKMEYLRYCDTLSKKKITISK